jgi:Xaa-Pro aminopeptidase
MTDALLLVGDSQTEQNLYYKTNFLAEGFVYLEMDGQRTIVASSMERGRAAKESSVPTIRTFDDYGYQQAMGELKDRNRAFATVLTRAVQEMGQTEWSWALASHCCTGRVCAAMVWT